MKKKAQEEVLREEQDEADRKQEMIQQMNAKIAATKVQYEATSDAPLKKKKKLGFAEKIAAKMQAEEDKKLEIAEEKASKQIEATQALY